MEDHIKVICSTEAGDVGIIDLNNPGVSNALSLSLLKTLVQGLHFLVEDQGVRCIIIHGLQSKNFCSGLHINELKKSTEMYQDGVSCPARLRMRMRQYIESLQECISSIERIPVPVIAAVHGYCVGAGVDLITACDIRICSEDARFCVKEVDLGIAADMGTLSRLPGICGDGIARELCLTASTISATRAYEIHLVSQVCETHDALLEKARVLAKSLAAKSPVAIAGTKECLLYHRDHGNVKDSLTYVAMMNAAMLPGNKDIDMIMSKKKNRFSKL